MERLKSLWLDVLILAVLVGGLWLLFDPRPAFENTHVAGGDTISHPWLAKSLKEAWARGDFWSWNHGWFAGFPFLYFYFYPVSALAVLLEVLGLREAVAFKVAILAVVTGVPVVFYATGRLWLSKPQALLFAALGSGIFLDEAQSFWGGSLKSVLAGQASHQMGILGMVGFFAYLVRGETGRPGAILFYCLAILGHVYTAFFGTLLLGVRAAVRLLGRAGVRRTVSELVMPAACVAMTAFWWVPFLFYRDSTVTPINRTVVDWTEAANILRLEDTRYQIVYAGLLLCLVVSALRRRFDPLALGLAALSVATAAALFHLEGTPFLHIRFASAIHLTALLGFLVAFRGVAVGPAAQWALAGSLAVVLLQGLVPSPTLDRWLPGFLRNPVSDSRGWWWWNMSGIERKAPRDHDALRVWSFLEDLDDPEGRVAFEYDDYNRYGSPRIFELTPYMTGKPVLEGLLLESSVNYPSVYYINFHFNPGTWWPGFPLVKPERDVARGVEYLARYNVRYFVAGRAPTRRDMRALGHPPLFTAGALEVFAVNGDSRIASRVEGELPVARSATPLMETVLGFPKSLDGIVEIRPGGAAPGEELQALEVGGQTLVPLDGRWSEDGQSYTVVETGAAPGRPQNVLFKISYFPNWRAVGGEPVRLVTPNLMLVRTERPSLTIEYRPGWPERLALLASVAALAGTLVAGVVGRARRARQQPPD